MKGKKVFTSKRAKNKAASQKEMGEAGECPDPAPEHSGRRGCTTSYGRAHI